MDPKNVILDAAKTSRDGVYVLAPLAGRVSFVSQQYRALNLVWALQDKEKIVNNDLVAVIGAGVAGLTAACALRAHGCTVHVFDKARAPLARQRNTTHRYVHPNINQWPDASGTSPTTSLPFLDWHYDQCNEVADRIETEWAGFLSENKGFVEFFPHEEVTNIQRLPGSRQLFLLQSRASRQYRYKLVLIACGFAKEAKIPAFPTPEYWIDDGLEAMRDEGTISQFVVSGCGDGGLCDALRLAYTSKQGRLSFEVAVRLAETDLAAKIASAEQGERNGESINLAYLEAAGLIEHEDAYKDLAGVLQEKISTQNGFVHLVDNVVSNPFETQAAPLHKLMIAYAMRKGVIVFSKGTVSRQQKSSRLTTVVAPPEHVVPGVEEVDQIFVGSTPYPARTTHVVIRHGARPNFGSLLTTEEVLTLISTQAQLAEYNYTPAWGNQEYRTPMPWPNSHSNRQKFITHRRPNAQSAMRKFCSAPHVTCTATQFIIHGEHFSYQPASLFGVPTVYTAVPVSHNIL